MLPFATSSSVTSSSFLILFVISVSCMYVQSDPDHCNISFRALPIEVLWKAAGDVTELPLDNRLKISIGGHPLDQEITYPMMQSLLSCNISEWSHDRRNHFNSILLSLYVIRECQVLARPIDEDVLLSLITECRVLNYQLTLERFHRKPSSANPQSMTGPQSPKRQAVLAGQSIAHYFELSPVLAAKAFDCTTVSDVSALPILNLIQAHWDLFLISADDFSNLPEGNWSCRPDGKSIAFLIHQSGSNQQDLQQNYVTTSVRPPDLVSIRTIEAQTCGDVVAVLQSELEQLAHD